MVFRYRNKVNKNELNEIVLDFLELLVKEIKDIIGLLN